MCPICAVFLEASAITIISGKFSVLDEILGKKNNSYVNLDANIWNKGLIGVKKKA